MEPASRPQLSVVTTMYKSASYLEEFYRRVSQAARLYFVSTEFVFVNDGSPDPSLEVTLSLQQHDPRVRIVDLTRNFGHHHAIVAGLEHATGDFVFLIDCDLEEEPESLPKLFAALCENDADAAYGVQTDRKGGFVERWGGIVAYKLIDALSAGDLRLPSNMMLARLMTRRYVDRFLDHRESAIVFSGLAATTGFRQVAVPLRKSSKMTTTYKLRQRVGMLVWTLTAFTDRPLHYIAYLGLTILIASFGYVVYLIAMYLGYHNVPAGYTSVAVSIWVLGGLILFSIGIVAIYLSIVFVEVKNRPRYLVRRLYEATKVDLQESHLEAPGN